MPLEFPCPECWAALSVKDEHAGKKMKCPKCAKVIPIPSPDDDEDEVVEEVDVIDDAAAGTPFDFDAEADAAPKKNKKGKKKKGAVKEEKSAPKVRGKTWGKYMPCPNCNGREAKRVHWTWWGFYTGPRMFTHVRCVDCGDCFNGKSGDTNVIPTMLMPSGCLLLVVGSIIGIYVALVRTGNWPPWIRFLNQG